MTNCQECGKELDFGVPGKPETWDSDVIYHHDIPLSSSPRGIEFHFCSEKHLMAYLIKVFMK